MATASSWPSSAGRDPAAGARPFEVNLIGRWSELGVASRATAATSLRTPLAGRSVEIMVEDADGTRRAKLTSVVPGRRYAIGKGEGSDIT